MKCGFVRRASIEDLAAIEEIERAVDGRWSRAMLAQELTIPGGRVWVACCEHTATGFAVWGMAADEAELLDLAVDPRAQRNGWGRLLLRRVLSEAASEGGRVIFLEVRASNEPAIALYLAEGFIEVGRRKGYYPIGDQPEDALVMSRRLQSVGEE